MPVGSPAGPRTEAVDHAGRAQLERAVCEIVAGQPSAATSATSR
jgi:hypothetical protein